MPSRLRTSAAEGVNMSSAGSTLTMAMIPSHHHWRALSPYSETIAIGRFWVDTVQPLFLRRRSSKYEIRNTRHSVHVIDRLYWLA